MLQSAYVGSIYILKKICLFSHFAVRNRAKQGRTPVLLCHIGLSAVTEEVHDSLSLESTIRHRHRCSTGGTHLTMNALTTLSQERFWGPSLVILNSSLWLLQRVHQGHMTMIKMNSYIDTCPFLVLLDSWIFQKDYIRPINHVLCYFSVTIIQEESWENAWSEIIYFIMYSFKLYMTEIWLCVKVA